MTFIVRELPKAKQDKRSIFLWLQQLSPTGAVAWLNAYDALLEHLGQHADSFGEALEWPDCELPIQQALFKTRRGRVYRVVYSSSAAMCSC